MKLKPEYEAVSVQVYNYWRSDRLGGTKAAIEEAVIRCQVLADRPVKMLTDEEIDKALESANGPRLSYARAIEAAHIAKQSAREVVPFNFALWQAGGWVAIDEGGGKHVYIFPAKHYPSMAREST